MRPPGKNQKAALFKRGNATSCTPNWVGNKKLPKGHVAEGKYAWLFVSEIIFMF